MDEIHGQLVQELKKLRERDGLSLRKLARQDTLCSVLGEPTAAGCFEVLLAAVSALGNSHQAYAVRSAWGLDYDDQDPGLLRDRRIDLSHQQVWSAGTDLRTIEKYENDGFDELAHLLLAADRDADEEVRPPPRPTGKVSTTSLVVEDQDRLHIYQGHALVEIAETVRVRAQHDGIRNYRVHFKTSYGPYASTLAVADKENLAEAVVFDVYNGWTLVGLTLEEPLAAGETVEFRYRLEVISEVAGYPDARVFVDVPTQHVACRVSLSDEHLPRKAWSYRYSWDHDEDSRAPMLVEPDEDNEMAAEFTAIGGHVEVGITWEW